MAVRKHVQHDYAKRLFINDHLAQNEIAERVGVEAKTVGRWVKKGKWEDLRVSLLVTKDNQIKALYGQLQALQENIKTRPIVRDVPNFLLKPIKVKNSMGDETLEYPKYDENDYPIKIGNFPNAQDTDMISKLTAAIKKLETETNVGETIEVCKLLIQFIMKSDPDLAKKLVPYCDVFIQEKMK